uniref:Putative secreted protein n=1 Tax=Anopheles triannulatus TaxID=58253 RepID=A0A2M4B747_9DIPT
MLFSGARSAGLKRICSTVCVTLLRRMTGATCRWCLSSSMYSASSGYEHNRSKACASASRNRSAARKPSTSTVSAPWPLN